MAKEVFLDELEQSEDTFLRELPFPTKDPEFSGDLPLGDRFALQDPKPINASNDLYKNLYEDEVPWDSTLSTGDRAALQQSFPFPKDIDMLGKRNFNALYFADQFNMPFSDALTMHDQLGAAYFDVDESIESLNIETQSAFYYDRIKNRYNNGVLNNAIGDKGASLLGRFLKNPESVDLEAELKIIQALQKGFTLDRNEDVRAWHEKMLGATAEQLPVLGRGLKGGIKGGVAGGVSGGVSALILGQLGPQAATPEEVLTVPAGVLYGLKTGSALGAGIAIGKLEAGNTFANLMSLKDENGKPIDPKIAALVSLGVGSINGAIEIGEWIVLLSTFGIGTKVFEQAARKVTRKFLVQGTLGEIVARHILKFGGQLAVENLQELWQESVSITGEELAKELNNARKGTDFKPVTKEEVVARLTEVTVESFRAFPALLLPGTVISTTKEAITTPKAGIPSVAQAIPSVAQPPKVAPKEVQVKPPEVQVPPITEGKIIDEVFEGDGTGIPSVDEQQQVPQQVKESKIEEQINSIVSEPLTPEQAEEDLTKQESAALKKLEAEIEIEDAEPVKPKLHIGNLTARMKKVLADELRREEGSKDPLRAAKTGELIKQKIQIEKRIKRQTGEAVIEDRIQLTKLKKELKRREVGPFLEGAFPTKKAEIEITAGEARIALADLEESLAKKLDNNLIRTENDLAEANSDWADIKELRRVLGEKLGKRPFTVIRATKTKVFTIESTKERIAASLRPGILEDSGLTVGQVLGVTLKRMAQAARHAFSVGKKEGIAITKEHFRKLKEAQRARKALKNRINKALKTINKDIPKNVDFFYREAISRLQKEVDTKKRTKDTKLRRQAQREFLAKATNEQKAVFPQKLFDSLNAKQLEDVTIAELEQLAEQRQKLEQLGKTKKSAKINRARLIRENNTKKAIKTMGSVKTSPEQDGAGYVTNNNGIITKLRTAHITTLRMPRLLDWLDGKLGTFKGLMHELFYNRVNDQTNKELIEVDRRHRFMRDEMDSLGITDDELSVVVDLSGVKSGLQLYVEQIMGVYAALKNPKAKEAMFNSMRITETQARAIVSNIANTKFVRLADAVIEDYNDSYERLRDAHINFTDEDLGREDFYTPIVRLEKTGIVSNDDITDQLLARSGLKRSQAEKGFTIERLNIAPENQKPIDLRLMSVWRGQSVKQEHYIHFAELIKDLNGYLSDGKLAKAINNVLGPAGHRILSNYVKRVANPNIYKGFGTMETLSRKLRGNMAMAYLSYNLLTIAKQAPSLVLYLKDAGADALLSSFGEFVTNPKALLEKVSKLDPQIRANVIAREFEALERARDPGLQKLINKVGRTGLQGIIFLDRIIRSIGWNAVYEKELSLHGSQNEAIREAQNSTLRTQPTASAKDLADLYTQNEVLNWFLIFTQQLNQIWNIVTYDVFAHWNNKNYQKTASDVIAVSLNAMLIWMITNKRLPEDEDDLLDMTTDQMINIVPLLGKDIMAGKKGWGGTDIAPLKAAKEISRAISSDDQEKIAKALFEQLAVVKGVPITAIKRGAAFLETGELIELIGGKK